MSQGYFVLRMSEDGDVSFDGPMTAAELEGQITADEDGETYYGRGVKFASGVPDNLDELGDGAILILKGEVVVPRAVQKVTEYKLP